MAYRRNSDGDWVGPVQTGIPGVLPEEAPLPSEVVLDGGILDRRRREALAHMRATLMDRPEEFAPDEWRVIVATLAPPAAHLGRAPGTAAARYGAITTAKECFPGASASTALRRFREVQSRPAVRAFIADLRALEMLDVLEQRGPVRERLWSLIRLADTIEPHMVADPDVGPQVVRAAAVATTAIKLLMDLDGLQRDPAEAIAGSATDGDDDKASATEQAMSLAARVRSVAEDMHARRAKGAAGGKPALIDATADEA